jgi:hypothetical protein
MKKAWFGPKRFGYGASPRSWEGWLATALFTLVIAGASLLLIGSGWGRQPVNLLVVDGALLAVFLVVVSMTYDKDA